MSYPAGANSGAVARLDEWTESLIDPNHNAGRIPRGMENIATAVATPGERNVAIGIGAVVVLAFTLIAPVSTQRLPEVPSFIPAVFSAISLAQILTAVLFFVQWRITGLAQLALLAIAYGVAALTGVAWMLVFPNVFAAQGLLGARPHTSGWLYFIDQFLFGAALIAFALFDRNPRAISRAKMRTIAALVFAAVLAVIAGCICFGDSLPATAVGRSLTPIMTHALVPFLIGEYVVVLVVIASARMRTVAHVWLFVVGLCLLCEYLGTSIAAERFSLGWYAGRFDHLVAGSLLLYVYFVKINDLLVRLASRNARLTERTEIDAVAIAEGEQRYRLLANTLPQMIWTTDASGNLEYVNDRWIAYAGRDLTQSTDDGWLRAVYADDRDGIAGAWHAALASGDPLSRECRLCNSAGRCRWFLLNALAVRDGHGTIVRWIATSTDIDIAKRIEERESYLSTVSERLAASIDIATTLESVTDLVVPRLGDWCQIDLTDEDGRFTPAAVRSIRPAKTELLRTLVGRPVEADMQSALERIVARGEPVVIRNASAFATTLPNVRDRAVYRQVAAAAAIVVPLATGDAGIGTLSLVFETDRTISHDDVSFARDLARRAALSLEHARLYERERATADALQRAMLPAQLPQLDHVRFSASYSAASESQRVGGDFYDAFALPDGRVALTIGDVTGHGLEAAVIMGEIRQALRAAAFERAEPSAILDRASRLLVASGRTVFVTAIFGALDMQTGHFSYSTAGHPAPLLFDGTQVIKLASSGLPIGLREDDGVDFTLNLHAPCTLTLFTDGLMEFGRDLDDGERRIESAIAALAGGGIEQLAAAIRQRVLGAEEATDDIAILTASIDRFPAETTGDLREWRFLSSDARAAGLARREIGELVARRLPDEQYAAELAFGELIANAVRHAPGPIVARCAIDPDGSATIELEDAGPGFAPVFADAHVFAEHGRGLQLLHRLSSDVRVETSAAGGARVSVRLNAQAVAALRT